LCRKHKIFKIHTTKYLLDRTSERKAMIQKHHGLQLPDKNFIIDPYLLGLWIGDGNNGDGVITQGKEDFNFIKTEIEN